MAVTISVEPDAVSNASAWTVTSDKDDATAKTITEFVDYTGTVAGTVKVKTSASHTYLTNDVIVITGTTNYNGTYDLTKIDADEFYITVAWVANDATGTTTLTNSNFRIKAELIISAVTVAVKWQPAGTLSWDFKRILWELITYTAIDFDSLNIQTANTDSYKSYTIKFTEYWENTSNALVTGANDTSDAKVIYKVDCTTFADYNLSEDDEEFLTERPDSNKIKIGDNIVTGWTNRTAPNGFDTFTSSGRNITSAIDSDSGALSVCYTNSLGLLSVGDKVEFYCNFTKNSGTFPIAYLGEQKATSPGTSNTHTFTEGYNYGIFVVTVALTNAAIMIRSTSANEVNFSMIQVYVSKGYNELDYLGFVSEETTLMPVAAQYDSDGDLIRTMGLDGVTISGDRGICPVSALLFAHKTTQVEKIILKVGTGLNLNGVELIEGWNAVSDIYDTFTVSGTQITSCIETTGNVGAAYNGSAAGGELLSGFISVLKGEVINISCTVTHNSGTLPLIFLAENFNLGKIISNQVRLSAGANDIDLTATKTVIATTGSGVYVMIHSPGVEKVNFSTTGDIAVTRTSFLSKGITLERNPVCWNNPIRIEWLNKFGAFDAYTFLDNYNEARTGKRSTYKNTSDVEQILDIENYQTIETFSNYETKTNLDWIKTILDSEKVYWIVDNVRIEIVVTGLSQVKKKKERVKLVLSFRKLI